MTGAPEGTSSRQSENQGRSVAVGRRGRGAATAIVVTLLLATNPLVAQQQTLDDFEGPSGWVAAPSDGVSLILRSDSGHTGKALRLDFDFQGHGGYAVARRALRLELPENYAFTFWIRGDAPNNNLEFKLVDSTGDNVWWRNQRNYTFSREWRKVMIRKRQIEFAWGPRGGGEAGGIASIELAITAGSGGKGSVWIDDFRLEPRLPDRPYDLTPVVTASSAASGQPAQMVLDGDSSTFWSSSRSESDEWLEIDFGRSREFGGLTIAWVDGAHPDAYTVELQGETSAEWSAHPMGETNGGRDHLYLPESEARRLRISMRKRSERIAIEAIEVQPLDWSESLNAFFRAVAGDAPHGTYPRYFDDVQNYWTMVGTSGDGRRSLLSQDGTFEPLAGGFSIEPFILTGNDLHTWADVTSQPSLEEGYLPIPSVLRQRDGLNLKVTAFSAGKGDSAAAHVWYRLQNVGATPRKGTLFLAIRPLQVNPPWQFLGVAGGVSRIDRIQWNGASLLVNDSVPVIPGIQPSSVGLTTFDRGDISEFLRRGDLPDGVEVRDPFGFASGALVYGFELAPKGVKDVFLRIPLSREATPDTVWTRNPAAPLSGVIAGWKSLLGRVTIDLPPSAQPIEDALKTTLGYMLINRDGPAIEPGARSYRRSWIRDGAMIGSAFLRLGHPEPVREFIEWYAPYQYESGKVPCCVDARGSDPVPEHDSHGELMFIIADYYRFTGDRAFLDRMWPHIINAARYIDSLRSSRRTAEYTHGEKRKYYGLMPPSISHEGYSAKPVHSYWDDFWVLRGLSDAADMAQVLTNSVDGEYLARLRDEFQEDLHASIRRTIAAAGIDFVPGSADLADYDPTSTSIALEPGAQLEKLPGDILRHTFERYLLEVLARGDSTGWEAYTPYEWRNVGALVRLGRRTEAKQLFDILFEGRRPAAWNQWPEVVHRDSLAPKFLGDLPHTWVGSDFVRSFLDMIAYVRQSDSALIIGAGVPPEWLAGPGVTVANLPIGQGRISVRMTATRALLDGNLKVPPGGILVYKPGSEDVVRVEKLPATISLRD